MPGSVTIQDMSAWSGNWTWGLPLILATVTIHAAGLLLISWGLVDRLAARPVSRFPGLRFVLGMGVSVLLVTLLHAVEATIWSIAYVRLEALPDYRMSMLYSLNAITAYGHVAIDLAPHWQMMGALEALNGMILFGLTTAFLFGALHKLSPIGVARRRFGQRGM